MKNLQRHDLRKICSKAGGFFLLVVFFEMILFTIVDDFSEFYFPINPTLSGIFIRFFSFLVPYTIMLKTLGKKPSDVMSIKRPKGQLFSYVTVGILVSVIANFITAYVIEILRNYNINSETPKSINEYENTPVGILLFLISLSVVPAITEEFVFRGVILGSLRRFGDRFAVFTSAFFFGLMHGNIEQFVFAFLLGLYLGFTVIKTNSMLPAILIHFLNNLISCIIIVFNLENFSMLLIIFYVVIFIISIFCLLKIYKDNKKQGKKIKRLESNLSFGSKMSAFIFNPGMILFFIYIGYVIYRSLKY